MSEINQIFNDTYFSARILLTSTRLRDTLEKNRNIELENATEEEKDAIKNNYKRKLQSIYRIRNNAYALLLKNGFTCTYKEQEDGSKIFYMNIEGDNYDCMENAIKNILGEEYAEIVKNCLPEEVYQKILEEEKLKKDTELENKKQKDAENKKKEKTSNTKKENSNKKNIDTTIAEDMLDLLSDIDAPKTPVQKTESIINKNDVEKNTTPQPETPKKTGKQERCTRCFAPLEEGQTICSFCGYDLNAKKILTREEVNAIDSVDEFSEEDIDKMFEELEKRLNALESKSNNDNAAQSNDNVSNDFDIEDFDTVRLYNPEKSEPIKKRSEMIMDIYTLKLKDPKGEKKDDEPQKEEHRRRRKNEIENVTQIEEDEDIIREVKIYVYPLSVPENGTELSSDILVFITQDENCGAFCSELSGIKTLRINTDIHNFIVRGQWDNGNFITKILCNGPTLLEQCEIERVKEEIRPDDIVAAKLGHPITFLSVEYVDGTETLKIHAVPISEQNDYDGYAKTLFLMENVNQKDRKLYITKASNNIAFDFEQEIYKATAKWKDDTFKMKIENYC